MGDFADYYRQIYALGMGGETPTVPVSVADLEQLTDGDWRSGYGFLSFDLAAFDAPRGALPDPLDALRAADRAYLLRAGERIAEGAVGNVLTRAQLEALYHAPVETLTDTMTGKAAFLPG